MEDPLRHSQDADLASSDQNSGRSWSVGQERGMVDDLRSTLSQFQSLGSHRDLYPCAAHDSELEKCPCATYLEKQLRISEEDRTLAAELGLAILERYAAYEREAKSKIEEMDLQIKEQDDRFKELQEYASQAETLATELSDSNNLLRYEIKSLNSKLQSDEERFDELQAAHAALLEEIEAKNKTSRILAGKVLTFEEATSALVQTRSKLADAEQQLEALSKKYSSLDQRHEKLKAEYVQMERRVEQQRTAENSESLQQALSRLEQAHRKLNEDHTKTLSRLREQEAHEEENKCLVAVVKELQSSQARWEKDLAETRQLLDERDEEIKELRNQVAINETGGRTAGTGHQHTIYGELETLLEQDIRSRQVSQTHLSVTTPRSTRTVGTSAGMDGQVAVASCSSATAPSTPISSPLMVPNVAEESPLPDLEELQASNQREQLRKATMQWIQSLAADSDVSPRISRSQTFIAEASSPIPSRPPTRPRAASLSNSSSGSSSQSRLASPLVRPVDLGPSPQKLAQVLEYHEETEAHDEMKKMQGNPLKANDQDGFGAVQESRLQNDIVSQGKESHFAAVRQSDVSAASRTGMELEGVFSQIEVIRSPAKPEPRVPNGLKTQDGQRRAQSLPEGLTSFPGPPTSDMQPASPPIRKFGLATTPLAWDPVSGAVRREPPSQDNVHRRATVQSPIQFGESERMQGLVYTPGDPSQSARLASPLLLPNAALGNATTTSAVSASTETGITQRSRPLSGLIQNSFGSNSAGMEVSPHSQASTLVVKDDEEDGQTVASQTTTDLASSLRQKRPPSALSRRSRPQSVASSSYYYYYGAGNGGVESEVHRMSAKLKDLQISIESLHQRLLSSDLITLNRKLRRAFDTASLTSLSNSIIDNVIMDAERLTLQQGIGSMSQPGGGNGAMIQAPWTPLYTITSRILIAHGKTIKTLNEYILDYVTKMESRSQEEVEKRSYSTTCVQSRRRRSSSSASSSSRIRNPSVVSLSPSPHVNTHTSTNNNNNNNNTHTSPQPHTHTHGSPSPSHHTPTRTPSRRWNLLSPARIETAASGAVPNTQLHSSAGSSSSKRLTSTHTPHDDPAALSSASGSFYPHHQQEEMQTPSPSVRSGPAWGSYFAWMVRSK